MTGFNSNVRYRGCVFHIQTEDSGRERPRVTSLLFVDGGQIVASRRLEYADLLADTELLVKLKQLMQDQHRELLRELRSGQLDSKIEAVVGALAPRLSSHTESKVPAKDFEILGAHSLVDPLRSVANLTAPPDGGVEGEARRQAPKPPLRALRRPDPASAPVTSPVTTASTKGALDEVALNDVILSFISQEIE